MIIDIDIAASDRPQRDGPVLCFDGDVLIVSWEYGPGTETRCREIDRVHPDADGLYAVGAYLWSWHWS